jgi:isopenicillin-N epimerase
VLTTDHAYPACRKALEHFAARRGFLVDVVEVPLPTSGPDEVVDRVLAGIQGRTRLALLDHVTSPTALVLPIERLVPALQDRGIDVLVDGAHTLGQVPVDLGALGAAYFTGNTHKWLCAPKSAAFLAVRPDRRGDIVPLVASHFIDLAPDVRFPHAFDWTGTTDPTPILAVPAAIDALENGFAGGITGLAAANRARVLAARAHLLSTLGAPEPAPASMIGSMAVVPLPDSSEPIGSRVFAPHAPTRLEVGLEAAQIQVPLIVWPRSPRRWLRISAQAYNTPADYERLGTVLTGLLR